MRSPPPVVFLALMALPILSGCLQLPRTTPPNIELPASVAPATTTSVAPEWWKNYGDPVLDTLIAEALSHNADLRLAAARIDEAAAALGLAEADRRPSATAALDLSRSRRTEVGSMPAPGDPTANNFQVGLRAAYAVDLWGRYRSASDAARADLLGSEFARDTLRLSLTAAVVKGYFALRALDAQTAVAGETAVNRKDAVRLQQLRFDAGEASELELRQAEAELAATESARAQLERQLRQQELALAALLGRSPRRLVEDMVDRGARLDALVLPPDVPAGLPSDLIERRPDIRRAEQALAAAGARIDEAKAAIFPTISLTASLGSESARLADLFSGPAGIWGVAAGLAQTLFNGGRTEAGLQARAARREQALVTYEETVRQSFREVLDALVSHRQTRDQAAAEARRAASLRQAVELADLRYRSGVSGHLELLDAQRQLFAAEQARIASRRQQLDANADLNAALGGGWTAGH